MHRLSLLMPGPGPGQRTIQGFLRAETPEEAAAKVLKDAERRAASQALQQSTQQAAGVVRASIMSGKYFSILICTWHD